ncbi:hypothetical protein ACO2I3_00545 [Leptospira interrogans]
MQPVSLISQSESAPARTPRRSLTESDAIDVWIARWLRMRRTDLCRRYQCDPRRLYEIWEGTKHPAARQKAWALFEERYPRLIDRIDTGNHRRIPRTEDHTDQLALFDSPDMQQMHLNSQQNKTRT